MGTSLEKRNRRAPRSPDTRDQPTTQSGRDPQWREVQFVPARWLVLAVSIAWALLSPGRIGKVGLASLVWSVTPRSVKIASAGFAFAATVVFVGAIAAIALLTLQLT